MGPPPPPSFGGSRRRTKTNLLFFFCGGDGGGFRLLFILILSCQLVRCSSNNYNNSLGEEGDYGGEEEDTGTENHHHYTRQWAAHINGGKTEADRIARKHGFINVGEIFPDYYHLVHRKVARRSIQPHLGVHSRLKREPAVTWLQQQKLKQRSKRDFLPLSLSPRVERAASGSRGGKLRTARRSRNFNFNDPRWPQMWYLNRGEGLDMNVIDAWTEGITGKGVVVTILDDGLEKDHPDIVRNYDPMASFDVNSLDMDPMPTYDLTDSNRHGTRCAGEVAAEANNSICAVGIAYEAGIGGVRMLDGDVTDAVEARSLSHNPQHIDIYSASWGPDDDGKTVDGPGELATRAFMEGVSKGRGGKGSIFVWASGNGGRDADNCNCDGYTNSIWTLSISSATENGLVPWYSEACSSTLATTYSSGGTGEKQIITIDLHHACTQSHTGTSASAPLAAGICALALQANMNLTWRDMQHIVVRTARPHNLIAPDWAVNGVGRNVSHSFGYGLMDAGAMVKLARKWKSVPEQNKCEVRAPYANKNIPAKSKVTLELTVTDCPGVKYLEHVQAKVTLMSGRRGDLQIYLISPAGTKSVLLAHRRHDLNRSGFSDWPFMTVHCWGESPIGKWTLEIHNEGRYTGRSVLKKWSLIAYGTEEDINPHVLIKDQGSSETLGLSTSVELSSSQNPRSASKWKKLSHGSYRASSFIFRVGNNRTSEIRVQENRKPFRQRQNHKRKKLSKKQKVITTTPKSKPFENHLSFGQNDDELKGLLRSKVNSSMLNEERSNMSSIPRIDAEIRNHTSAILSPTFPSSITVPSSSLSIGVISITPHSNIIMTTPAPASTTVENLNQSQNDTTTGKLQTWALLARGIEYDPNNDEKSPSTIRKPENGDKNGLLSDKQPPTGDFDGSDNSIAIPLNNAVNPGLAIDSTDSVLSSSSGCAKSSNQGQCLECDPGLALMNGQCLNSCSEGYYPEGHSPSGNPRMLLSYKCLPCHYTCRTCTGSEANECLSCYGDAMLGTTATEDRYCYTNHFLNYFGDTAIWYKLLIFSLIVNILAIVVFIYWVCTRRVPGKCCWSRGETGIRSRERSSQRYTRLSPEDDNIPSGDEFENLEMESENEEFVITSNIRDNVKGGSSYYNNLNIGGSTYSSNIKSFSIGLSSKDKGESVVKDSTNSQDAHS